MSDGLASATLPAFSIAVESAPVANRAPTISGTPATSVTVGQAYVFQPAASDPDGQALRFGIANAPTWATFDVTTGRLSGTPGAAHAGTTASNIVISVSDGLRQRHAAGVQHHGRRGAGRQSRADDQRHAGDQRDGGPGVLLPAGRQRP